MAPAAAEGQTAAPAPAPEPTTVTINAKRHALSGDVVRFSGKLSTGEAGRRVGIKRRTGDGYVTLVRTRTRAGGRYSVKWRAGRTGSFVVRAYVRRDGDSPAAAKRLKGRMRVYVPRHASYYGPGLYGNKLACGGTLTPSTVGVAHKTLPCGTRVTLRNRGRTLTVRVVDRGPYVGGRFYDLTEATKRKLRFGSTGNVWSTK